MKTCKQCSAEFQVRPEDQAFYQKIQVPEPALCPSCRMQRRMAYRNEKTLYKRKCDLCKKSIVSVYSADVLFPVYCQECFFGDKWNALEYGREFDFTRPFFEQFFELLRVVPRLSIVNKQSENSDYCNYSFANKNCYLTFGSHYEEDCLYSRYSTKNRDCLDCLWLYGSELCYECLFSKNCYHCLYLLRSEQTQNSFFSRDLKGCEHCLFCANLQHKKFHILNTAYSEEEYFAKLTSYQLDTAEGLQKARAFFVGEFQHKFPKKAWHQVNCQNCFGSDLENSKNAFWVFAAANTEDIAYSSQIDETYSSQDMTCMGYDRGEVCYQTIGCTGTSLSIACDSCWHDRNLAYCNLCFSSNDVLGSIGLHHKSFVILNKQYSKTEYEVLVRKIMSHMRQSGEWGEFFPSCFAPFAYNETIAQEYFPRNAETAKSQNLIWKKIPEPDFSEVSKKIAAIKLPESTAKIPDDVLNWAIECAQSKRLFKIQKAELAFYRAMNIPLPRLHPDVRLAQRLSLRDSCFLWPSHCQSCQKSIFTVMDPTKNEMVYCEECYARTVY